MEELQLTLGSKYLIKSILSREQTMETEGTFKGVTTIGTNDAIVMELGPKAGPLKGKLRLIPSHMIVCVDIIEAASPANAQAKRGGKEENVQYG